MPGEYDFTIYQGSKWVQQIAYRVGDVYQDLSNYLIRMQIRAQFESTSAIADLDSDTKGGIAISSTASEGFTITIAATVTSGYTFGMARYDIEIVPLDSNGDPTEVDAVRLLYGKVRLIKEVTR